MPSDTKLADPKFDLMTKLEPPSIVPDAGVTVMLFTKASPFPSLIVMLNGNPPFAVGAGKVSALAEPVGLFQTIRLSEVVAVSVAPAVIVLTANVELPPDESGVKVVPFQRYKIPVSEAWHIHGIGNRLSAACIAVKLENGMVSS